MCFSCFGRSSGKQDVAGVDRPRTRANMSTPVQHSESSVLRERPCLPKLLASHISASLSSALGCFGRSSGKQDVSCVDRPRTIANMSISVQHSESSVLRERAFQKPGGGADWDPMPLKLRFLEQLISLENHGIDQTGTEFA